jgi:hypothetical protein
MAVMVNFLAAFTPKVSYKLEVVSAILNAPVLLDGLQL